MVLLQVLILNNVHIAGYATPFLYIYLILKFESDTPRNALMLWAFFLGLAVDVFSDTPGMNAAATVLLAFLRPTFLRLFVPRDTLDTLVPAIRTMGILPFLKYLVVSVLIHHGLLLTLEFFSLAHIGTLLLRIVASTLLTVTCIMAVEGIRKKGLWDLGLGIDERLYTGKAEICNWSGGYCHRSYLRVPAVRPANHD